MKKFNNLLLGKDQKYNKNKFEDAIRKENGKS